MSGSCNNPGGKPVGVCTGVAASGWRILSEAEGLRGRDSSGMSQLGWWFLREQLPLCTQYVEMGCSWEAFKV